MTRVKNTITQEINTESITYAQDYKVKLRVNGFNKNKIMTL